MFLDENFWEMPGHYRIKTWRKPHVHPDAFREQPVLVTGGAGMLGSSLVVRLVELGARVRVLDAMLPDYGGNLFNLSEVRDRIEWLQGDIRDPDCLRRALRGVRTVFNLAAQVSYIDSNIEMEKDLQINCLGQIRLLEACRALPVPPRVLFSSSRFVYGRIERNPVDESHPLHCLSIYGIHKLAGEKYHRFFYDRYGLPTVSLRIANPYGPRQQMKHSKYGIVNWFIRLGLEGKPLTVYGSGLQKRDYIYVEDLVEAFLSAAVSPKAPGQVYNVGSGQGISFRQMAEEIARQIPGCRVEEVAWHPSRYFVETGDYVSDIGALRRDTGWQPRIGLSEGIARTIAYYRRYREFYWNQEEALTPARAVSQ